MGQSHGGTGPPSHLYHARRRDMNPDQMELVLIVLRFVIELIRSSNN